MNGYDEGGFLVPENIRASILGVFEAIAPARKASMVQLVPQWMLDDTTHFQAHFAKPQTAEERAANAARHEARLAAANKAITDAYEQLLAAAAGDELALAVLHLHRPEGHECAGDDFSGYECEPPDWPCRTALLIGERVGVDVPRDPWSDGYRRAGGDASVKNERADA
ncbi:MAG TPA: hypothetical protein VFQ42_04135 [Mycobacterium sp.]|nr:hypothetical protein [Mycobacterium sp.]